MCQLLGMNSATPTCLPLHQALLFQDFLRRGGETDNHSHGWGCAIYETGQGGLQCFHDTLPASQSPIAQLVLQNYRIPTHNMMAHIRYATQGSVSLENVHPFTRELWGIQWTFAHNGDCPKFSKNVHCSSFQDMPILLGRRRGRSSSSSGSNTSTDADYCCYHPNGDTDSEAVFCAILNAIKAEFSPAGGLPTLSVLHEFLQELCHEIVNNNNNNDNDPAIFNFLLGCGQYTLFAYSWPGSRPGSTVWNGLHYIVHEKVSAVTLLDDDGNAATNFRPVTTTTSDNDHHHHHRVAIITTKPLTQETDWCEMKRGQLIMFDHGKPHFTAACCHQVELEGRGLCSKVLEHFPKKTTTTSISRSPSFSSSTSTSSTASISSSSSLNSSFSSISDNK